MTAIPPSLVTHDKEASLLITLERVKRHGLTPDEAKSDLFLLFDVVIMEEHTRRLGDYLMDLIDLVQKHELSPETASKDILEILHLWRTRASEIEGLLDIGIE
jgi:hypothetical protein